MLEELQKQLPFGGDIELLVDTPAMVFHGANGDAEAPGDVSGGVSGQDELDEFAFPL